MAVDVDVDVVEERDRVGSGVGGARGHCYVEFKLSVPERRPSLRAIFEISRHTVTCF